MTSDNALAVMWLNVPYNTPFTEKELAELGFKPEPRDYRPHLTLGRTRSGSRRAATDVVERLKQQSDCRLGSYLVDRLQLFASYLDRAGPSYHVMDTIEL